MPTRQLTTSCADLVTAARDEDAEQFEGALRSIVDALAEASPTEMREGLTILTPALAEIPLGVGHDLAQVAGAMADGGGDPLTVLPVLVRRAAEALEQAARFADIVTDRFGDLPEAEDPSAIEATIEQLTGAAAELGMTEQEAYHLVAAWFTAGHWTQPVLFLSQRKDVRHALPERERLVAATEAVDEYIGTAHWLYGLLLVLDDTRLTVIHRPTGRGYQVTISGIGDNFQLHTLLAAGLIGDESRGLLPGQPPSPEEVAAATAGEELSPAGGITGQFNLVDGNGEWIWNEGRPADIPLVEGERLVVIDPPSYARCWNAGRAYPLMRPELTLDRILPADEAERWLRIAKPATR